MKKICYYIVLCVILLCLSLLVSCFYPDNENKEGILIHFPTKQIYEDRPGEEYFAQVYLLIERELFPLGEKTDYIEQELDEEADQTSITVDKIPAGRYILWLGIGIKREENGAFNVQYYYESEEFDLIAGSTTTLTATLLPCPFNKALNVLGEDINGAVIDTNDDFPQNLYASGPDNLYYYNGIYNALDPDFNVDPYTTQNFTGYYINSISRGLDYVDEVTSPENCLYLSTTVGISKWDGNTGSSIDDTFSTGLEEVNVLRSLAYGDTDNHVTTFFQRNGGLGGVQLDNNAPDWVNVDYSEVLKDQLVFDFFVTDNLGADNGGYFATAFGALMVPQIVIDDYEEGDEVNLMSQVDFFEVEDINTGKPIPIISLGYDPDYGTPENSTVYMGTQKGLYYTTVGPDPPIIETPQPELLEDTQNRRIFIILINTGYRAYASLTYLYLQDKLTDDVVSLPFVAGMPGKIATMDWDGNTLVIAGTLGLVTLDVDTLF